MNADHVTLDPRPCDFLLCNLKVAGLGTRLIHNSMWGKCLYEYFTRLEIVLLLNATSIPKLSDTEARIHTHTHNTHTDTCTLAHMHNALHKCTSAKSADIFFSQTMY